VKKGEKGPGGLRADTRSKNQGNKETSGQERWSEKKKKTRRQPYEGTRKHGINWITGNKDNWKWTRATKDKGTRGKGRKRQRGKETRGQDGQGTKRQWDKGIREPGDYGKRKQKDEESSMPGDEWTTGKGTKEAG